MAMPDLNKGAMAPVCDEADLSERAVTGTIPTELHGILMRNGPNPLDGRFAGTDVLSWWPEAAMLHGVAFADGRCTGYRNRWVRTRRWATHADCGQTSQRLDSNPNVNVIAHAGAVLALAEGGPPVTINDRLDTLGQWQAHSSFASGMTAHPKIDPHTHELITFKADWQQPWLRYGVLDAKGQETFATQIEVSAPAMMHDMAITATHSILMDLNVGYDFQMLQRGYRLPIRWFDSRQSRLALIPRHGGPVAWFNIAPCFIQHVVNAYDAPDNTIVLQVVRYPWYFRENPDQRTMAENPLGVLWQYTIDPVRGCVREQQLDELAIELPRINESFTGRQHRYLYAVEQPSTVEMRGLVRYDLHTGNTQHHRVAPGDQNSEPIFVPRPGATAEDDGWLLVSVYKQATHTNEIRILDATDIHAAPVATIDLQRRIPAGFHGAWIAAR